MTGTSLSAMISIFLRYETRVSLRYFGWKICPARFTDLHRRPAQTLLAACMFLSPPTAPIYRKSSSLGIAGRRGWALYACNVPLKWVCRAYTEWGRCSQPMPGKRSATMERDRQVLLYLCCGLCLLLICGLEINTVHNAGNSSLSAITNPQI